MMNQNELSVRDRIVNDIQKHYKKLSASYAYLSGDYLTLMVPGLPGFKMPLVAKRILSKSGEVRVVHFTGGWTESVYTRETLRWAGYKI